MTTQSARPLPERLSVSIDEASTLLGISRSGVLCELNSGRLKSFSHGTRRVISMTALKEWVVEMERSGGISLDQKRKTTTRTRRDHHQEEEQRA